MQYLLNGNYNFRNIISTITFFYYIVQSPANATNTTKTTTTGSTAEPERSSSELYHNLG